MKCKVITAVDAEVFEQRMNEFLKTHDGCEIYYSTTSTHGMTVFSALIVFY